MGIFRNEETVAGKIVKLMKCLPFKPKALSLDIQHPCKNPNMVAHDYSPTHENGGDWWIQGAYWPANVTELVNCGFSERSCLKKGRWGMIKKDTEC